MNKTAILLMVVMTIFLSNAQEIKLQNGDFIFQNLACGPLCEAINEVTKEVESQSFNHMGLIIFESGKPFVIEASGVEVRKVSLDDFLLKSKEPHLIGRLIEKFQPSIDKAIAFAEKQLGVPYDETFLYDNGKYYCSELIYDAFKEALGQPLFALEPMSFNHPQSDSVLPEWLEYFQNLGMQVPEGELGCNPTGIANSSFLKILGTY